MKTFFVVYLDKRSGETKDTTITIDIFSPSKLYEFLGILENCFMPTSFNPITEVKKSIQIFSLCEIKNNY